MNGRLTVISLGEKPESKTLGLFSREGYTISDVGDQDVWGRALPVADILVIHCGKDHFEEGRRLLGKLRQKDEGVPIIFLTGMNQVHEAVEIMKMGAFDYLQTPPDNEKLKLSLSRALQNSHLTKRVRLLESQVGWDERLDDIVGHSPQMREVFQMIQTVAKSTATVLIMGESGTGKELVAKAIHRHSDRGHNKFIDINCGAIPRELLENELFGHEKGSFTGADRQYIGSCERATGGTLFLDEVSEMDPTLQVKLLRVLQERNIMRIGGSEKINIDIRIIAATNRDLKEEIKKGTFREDLYYRLNVVPMTIHPLRERREDIPPLAQYFLEKYSKENAKKFKGFAPEALESLINYDWPGNVRELENNIERIVVLNEDTRVKQSYLPRFIVTSDRKASLDGVLLDEIYQKIVPLEQVEQYAIENALKKCQGDVIASAKKLQIGQATLYRKIKKYGIQQD